MSGAPGIPVPDDLILVAHVTGAYGLAGWVKLKPYSDDAGALVHAKTWWLDKPELRDVDVLLVRSQGEDLVAQLMGVADRNSAEALKGATVQVRRAHFPPLDDGEFYWIDLIGLAVVNRQGEALGTVIDLIDTGAHSVLRLRRPDAVEGASRDASERLIPFVAAFIDDVSLSERRITVDWGLDF